MNELILRNYEISKLSIDYPTVTNVVILGFLLIISLLWTQKQSTRFLDRDQTDQLRGGSILLVIMTHLWQHVSAVEASPHLSGYGVSMFLFISGFALTSTLDKPTFTWSRFLSRRLRRMMVPYWALTVVWLFADYFLLHRTYALRDMMYTFAGINIRPISDIDYVRWYITWIIMWYFAFAASNRLLSNYGAMLSIFGFGIVLLVLRVMEAIPLVSHPIHMLTFPLGMLVATYRRNVTAWLSGRETRLLMVFGTASLVLLSSGLVLLGWESAGNSKAVSTILGGGAQLAWCVVFAMAVAALGRYGYVSKFLKSWGTVSYGAFLIHGPLLIKYNPIMGLFPGYAVVISFLLFLAMVWVLAFFLHSFLDHMWKWLDTRSQSTERLRALETGDLKVRTVDGS
ncbi:MAG: acyltransferase family protein [Thermodesulfobacteriota bacterium]